jgi:amino acid adenylation domain-containing protein
MQKDNIQDIYSLSPLQEGLFFHNITDRSSSAYFIQVSYRLHGKLNACHVQQSLNMLAERYDVLRTSFVLEGLKKTFQVVLKERKPDFIFEDISAIADQDAFLQAARLKDRERSFDLTHDPLMRVTMLKLGDAEYEFIWSHHHITMDGWCTGIVIQEFSQIYESLQHGRTPVLPPVTQYKEYIRWLEKRDRTAAADYWKNYVEGFDVQTGIAPTNTQQPAGYDNCEVMAEVPKENFDKLQELCGKLKVTLNSLMQSAWALLLSRYTNREDLVFGTVVSIRPPEIRNVETMVGLFINTLPVRITLNRNESFTDLVARVQKNALQSERHQSHPLADIQASSALKQNLLDHVFVVGNYPVADQLEGMRQEPAQDKVNISDVQSHEQVNYHFSINISGSDHLRIRFNYNGLVYNKEFIERLAGHYLSILHDITADPSRKLDTFRMLSQQEEQELVALGKGPRRHYPGSIDSLFRQQAEAHPAAIAVEDVDQQVTYAQLDELSTSLAIAMQEAGVEKGSYVAVKAGRSIHSVVSLLGIAKAGAVYVPVEPNHPNERVSTMLSPIPLSMFIVTSEYLFDLPETTAPVFAIDLQLDSSRTDRSACRGSQAGDTAYVIFTSGTTGQPKGIPVRHESIVDRALYHAEYLGLDKNDGVMQFASVAFDASVIEMLMTLLSGSRLCIPPVQAKQDPLVLADYINSKNISVGILPPAYLKLLDSQALPGLKQIISTGEAAILKDMLAHACTRKVHNGYGPTEVCIGASFHTVDTAQTQAYLASGRIPIGKPFSNTDVYVLDHWGQLTPAGVAGELCVAGIGVTNGYLSGGPLSETKFIANEFNREPGYGRVYRTGDLVQWNDQYELVYLGRIDEQVQVRGIRVELSEIESALFKYPGLVQASVVPYVKEGNTYLVAYVTAPGINLSIPDVYAHLRKRLPEYMVPVQITLLERMPVTSSGKIDRAQLPPFDLAAAVSYEAPVGETEQILAGIWEEVLDRTQIGRHDNFFQVGGHSLKATQIVSALFRQMNIRLDIGQIFSQPTIALLAPVLQSQQASHYTPIKEVIADDYPVTPSQRRLWVLQQLGGAGTAYNISGTYIFKGNLQVSALEAAFHQLVSRHESLRTSFVLRGERLRQVTRIFNAGDIAFEQVQSASEDETASLVHELSSHEFNLDEGNLFRVRLIRQSGDHFVLACVMHHIISDGWSVRRMFHELSEVYNQLVSGKTPQQRPLSIQYHDYASWLEGELDNTQLSQSRQYWISTLQGRIEPLQLVADYPRPALQTFNGNTVNFSIDQALMERVRHFANERQMSVFMVLLAAVKLLLHRYSNQQNITVGSAVSGREHPDVQELIGCFINTVVLSTDIDPGKDVNTLLEQVKKVTLGAFANQLYPFDQLVEELDAERDLSRSALFDVLVNHQVMDASDEQVRLQGIEVEKFHAGKEGANSKFDLEFEFYEHSSELAAQIVYNTDLYKPSTISNYARQLVHIITGMMEQPGQAVREVSLTTEAEDAALANYSKGPQRDYDVVSGYSEQFDAQAYKSPQAIAVEDAVEAWTYADMQTRANQAASIIQQQAGLPLAQPHVIAISSERSCKLVALAMGAWKSGCIYMPVDPLLPDERVRYMLEDAGASLFITDKIMDACPVPQAPINAFFGEGSTKYVSPGGNADANGAYLLYTSGSTGRPKGVLVGAAGMLNHMHSKIEDLQMDNHTIVAQTASQGFDVSVWQTFAALLCGGKVHIYTRMQMMELRTHIADLQQHRVSIMQVVPSYLNELLEELEKSPARGQLPALRYLISAGEELSASLAARWFERMPHARIANCYGPAEATDNISIHIMDKWNGRERVPVGRPLANMNLYVVDANGRLCPQGIAGEIWVSGIGVVKGYIGQEKEQSQRVFMDDPFHPGRRLYRTGDLGRWRPDGIMEFHGRADRQVKLRGQRIELGEVERAMQAFTDVKQSAVVFEPDEQGGSLTGYVVWKESAAGEDRLRKLRSHMSVSLASYMVPRHIVELTAFPLTHSGKIDRKKLPKQTIAKKKMLLPVNDAETSLLELWKEILKRDDIGVEDNFFDLGGHSLKAMRLLAVVEQHCGTRLQLQEIFKYPTIRSQAKLLETVSWLHQADVVVNEEETVII